jgi:lipopolysaccharide cholinephosphotransferase
MTHIAIDQLHDALRRGLQWFVEIAEEHSIEYFVDAGTLLGLVRSGGFIAWDDDIDICLRRQEFNRLLLILDETPLPEELELHHADSITPLLVNSRSAKLRLKGCHGFETNLVFQGLKDLKANSGPAIDLVPLDTVPKSRTISWLVLKLARFAARARLLRACNLRQSPRPKIKIALAAISVSVLPSFVDSLCLRVAKTLANSFAGGHLAYSLGDLYPKGDLPEDVLFPTQKSTFENLVVRIPANPDLALKRLFGERYLVPPPPEKQAGHFKSLVRLESEKGFF